METDEGKLVEASFKQTKKWRSPAYITREKSVVFTRICPVRGALMHGLQGAEAQGPTLERGPTGCREIIFF